ncbi:MAG: HAMP domain-containing protein [Sneathiella sp.]|nr:HAMP domain-containing protein [Sneathiella sp.]
MWLAAVLISSLIVRHELDEAFDSALQETAQRLLSLAVVEIMDHEGALSERRISPVRPHDEFVTYVVRDQFGNILLHSHDADRSVFPTKPRSGFSSTATHRIYGEAAVSDSIFIEVAEPLTHRRQAAMESTLSMVVPLVLFLPFSVVGVWWLVRHSMQPVIGLSTQIEARSAGDLSPVTSAALPDEIGPIAIAVNNLMERLQRSLEAERSFTANSAHELRTPIAGALAQTQRLISSLPENDLRTRAQGIEASLQRLARISEKLMQLARAEGGGIIVEKAIDLGPVLDAIVDEFRRHTQSGARLRYTPAEAGTLVARIDADAFAILMRNLIENALKHSPAKSRVDIELLPGQVRVINVGPVLAPETLGSMTKPFKRGSSKADGSGLGLAIAAAIATNGNIGLNFQSPASDRQDGFESIVNLPLK